MKILLIGSYSNQKCVLAPLKVANSLFKEFLIKGHDVKYFTYFDDGKKYSRVQKLFGKENINSSIFRYGILNLIKEIIKFNPDIIQIVNAEAFYLILFLMKPLLRGRIIYLSHSNISYDLKYFMNLSFYESLRLKTIEFCVNKFSDMIITLSNKNKRCIRMFYKIEDKKIIVLPNGVESLQIIKEYKEKQQIVNLIAIGSIKKTEKGLDFLIDTLLKSKLKFNLTICDYLPQSIENINISEYLKIELKHGLGQEELRNEIAKNDLIIVPSKVESFSLALLEAMNTGILFLASKKVGLTERFQKKIEELTFKYGNQSDLMSKIENLNMLSCTEKNAKAKLIRNFSLNFTWDKVADSYLDIYKEVLND